MSVHTGVYANSFFDTRSAKRAFPILVAIIRVSVLTGSVTVPLMNQLQLAPQVIIAMWALTMLLMIATTYATPYFIKGDFMSLPQRSDKRSSYVASLREGYAYVLGSSYLRSLALFTFLMMFMFTSLFFQAYKIFESILVNTAKITDYTSAVIVVGSILFIPVQLLLISRMIARLGVGNFILLYPFILAVVTGLLAVFPERLFIGGLIFFCLIILNVSLRATGDELLYNAIPVRIKGRARAFITGFMSPFGTLTAGLLTLPQLPISDHPKIFLGLTTLAAVSYVGMAWLVRRQYGQALINLLAQENYAFLLDSSSADFRIDAATLKRMEERLYQDPDEDFRLFMATVMLDLAGEDALPSLEKVALEGSPAFRVGILETFRAAQIRSDGVKNLCLECLKDADPQVRRTALIGLEEILGAKNRAYQQLAIQCLDDEDVLVKAEALPALISSNDMAYLQRANATLNEFVGHSDPDIRAIGVGILGQTRSARIVEYFQDSAESVRLAAVIALEEMVMHTPSKQTSLLAEQAMPPLLNDPVERIRVAAIQSLGLLAKQNLNLMELLIPSLMDKSPRVRSEVANTFVNAGKPALEKYIRPLVKSESQAQVNMAVVVLARLEKERANHLIQENIRANLKLIYTHIQHLANLQGWDNHPSIQILSNALLEQNDEWLEEIFYMLSALHSESAIRTLTSALESEQARNRTNAAEALESLVSPQLARLITPLYDPAIPLKDLEALAKSEFQFENVAPQRLIEYYFRETPTPWLRVIMTFALGEMGAELAKLKHLSQNVQQKSKIERRKRGVTALFDKLDEPPLEEIEKATTQIVRPVLDASVIPFNLDEIQIMLRYKSKDTAEDPEVILAARAARRVISNIINPEKEENYMLSAVEKVIFLKGVPFFAGMTVNQLKALAAVTEEKFYSEDSNIFSQGDAGGTLYVVVNGKVGVERMNEAGTATARVKDVTVRGYFGETTLFDNSDCTTSAIALNDTLVLALRHEPLMALIQQYPDLSLQLIKVLSKRIQESDEQVADLSRRRSRTVHKLYDKLN